MNWKKSQGRWENDGLNRTIDKHEEYSCRNCIFVHDIKDTENENTDAVVAETFNELSQE